jgi:RND family efflux transporter MFP subunit
VKVFVNVPEKDIPLITFGKKAKIFCDAYPQKEFNGSVSRLSQAVDVSTRTMAVEITIPNPEHMLKPGMFVAVSLIIGERANCITVPTMALLKDEKGAFVFIVNGDKALRRDIVIGREQGSNTEILSGLDGSENVVTVGQQFVKDGVAVMVQK